MKAGAFHCQSRRVHPSPKSSASRRRIVKRRREDKPMHPSPNRSALHLKLGTLGGVPKPSRAMAPPSKARLRQRDQVGNPGRSSQTLPRYAPPSKARLRQRDQVGNPGRSSQTLPRYGSAEQSSATPTRSSWEPWEEFPNPPALWLRRAKLGYANAIKLGTLGRVSSASRINALREWRWLGGPAPRTRSGSRGGCCGGRARAGERRAKCPR